MIRTATLFGIGLLVSACAADAETSVDDGSGNEQAIDSSEAESPASAQSLDAFLGFEDPANCTPNPAFEAFDRSLWADAQAVYRGEPPSMDIPEAFRAGFGEVSIIDLGDRATRLRIPVEGEWLGLPLHSITSLNVGYDWYTSIVFDVPPGVAEVPLREAGFPVRAGEAVDGDYYEPDTYFPVYELQADDDPDRAAFSCLREDRG